MRLTPEDHFAVWAWTGKAVRVFVGIVEFDRSQIAEADDVEGWVLVNNLKNGQPYLDLETNEISRRKIHGLVRFEWEKRPVPDWLRYRFSLRRQWDRFIRILFPIHI